MNRGTLEILEIPDGVPSQLGPNTKIYRDQCAFSFDTPLMPLGLDIHLQTYHGCARRFSAQVATPGCPWFLNIRHEPKNSPKPPPAKIAKLEILAAAGASAEDFTPVYSIYNSETQRTWSLEEISPEFQDLVAFIASSDSSERREQIELWQYLISLCSHSSAVGEKATTETKETVLNHCHQCTLEENLWICLECGAIGCGRSQFGSSVGGNSHALSHYDTTGHAVAVKLGSLAADRGEECDAYCYKCGDEVKVPHLATCLRQYGINLESTVQTEKTLVELNLDQNLTWQFKLDGANGELLQPVFGPGLTGLTNLGNSCYMNAVLQLLFSTRAYTEAAAFAHDDVCKFALSLGGNPYLSMHIQLAKLHHGLTSERYSVPELGQEEEGQQVYYQKGIRPSTFKNVVAMDHAEFAGPRQQDASEYLSYFMDRIDRTFGLNINSHFQVLLVDTLKVNKHSGTATYLLLDNLTLNVPAILQSVESGVETYCPILFEDCLQQWALPQQIPDYVDDEGQLQEAQRQTGVALLPLFLLISLQRIAIKNWTPVKMNVSVSIPYQLDMSQCIIEPSTQLKECVPSMKTVDPSPATFEPNQEYLTALVSMGFPEPRCIRALYNTNNSSVELASSWIFEHMDDPGVDEPFVVPSEDGLPPPAELVATLAGMGFAELHAVVALKQCGNNVEAAVEWLFANPDGKVNSAENGADPPTIDLTRERTELISSLMQKRDHHATYRLCGVICHKGTSPHTGHYVAYIRKLVEGVDKWVLFNDEKVVLCDEESMKEVETNGYVYLFQQD